MIQEYLVYDIKEKDKIINHDFEQKDEIKQDYKIQKNVIEIIDATSWMISYSVKSNSEDAAKLLSEVDKWIIENVSVIVLTNESSAYFNKMLFPIINDFERNLRKLLYLMSAKHEKDTSSKNIKNLEDQDLGKIFELLFTDSEFTKKIRELIKYKSWNFTKSEIVNDINNTNEITVWDQLVGNDIVPSLRQNFIKVKDYRNHVMHAHNINYKTYYDIKKLFKNINAEIDDAIESVTGKRNFVSSNFNTALSEALNAFANALETEEFVKTMNKSLVPTLNALSNNLSVLNSTLYSENNGTILENLSQNKVQINLNTNTAIGKDDNNLYIE